MHPPPPPRTKGTIVGNNEIYRRETLIGPFLVHKCLGPRPPPPPSSPSDTSWGRVRVWVAQGALLPTFHIKPLPQREVSHDHASS